jgi:putative PIN family toxin of toxin-antitoxin system
VRVFLDSNVLISAFTTEGVSSTLFDGLNLDHHIIVSPLVLSEFERILIQKFGVNPTDVQSYVRDIAANSEVIDPPYAREYAVRDPDDVDILAAALKGNADVLVTGDKDLLDMPNPPIPILRPRTLYDRLKG